MKDQLAIYPNRLTLLWGFLGSIAFVAISAHLLYRGDVSPFTTLVCWGGLLFFGFGIFACGFMLGRSLIKHRPQLLLDTDGITFFDGDGTPHHVGWEEVQQFRELTIARQRFILMDVEHPTALIDAEKSAIRRRLMEHNLMQYGTPFNLAANNLKYPKAELLPTLRSFHQKYRLHGSA